MLDTLTLPKPSNLSLFHKPISPPHGPYIFGRERRPSDPSLISLLLINCFCSSVPQYVGSKKWKDSSTGCSHNHNRRIFDLGICLCRPPATVSTQGQYTRTQPSSVSNASLDASPRPFTPPASRRRAPLTVICIELQLARNRFCSRNSEFILGFQTDPGCD